MLDSPAPLKESKNVPSCPTNNKEAQEQHYPCIACLAAVFCASSVFGLPSLLLHTAASISHRSEWKRPSYIPGTWYSILYTHCSYEYKYNSKWRSDYLTPWLKTRIKLLAASAKAVYRMTNAKMPKKTMQSQFKYTSTLFVLLSPPAFCVYGLYYVVIYTSTSMWWIFTPADSVDYTTGTGSILAVSSRTYEYVW